MSLCAYICILSIVGCALAASEEPWTRSAHLQRGQADIHQIQVDDSASFKLKSPPGGQYRLYAMQVAIAGGCPGDAALRGMSSYRTGDSLVLPQGQWCIEVHAEKGSGRYYLDFTPISGTQQPTATPTPIPTIKDISPTPSPVQSVADPEEPYKVSVQSGTISPNYPNVHSYLVSGERTLLEWILEPSDCTNPIDIPVVRMSGQDISALQSAVCPLDLDIYVYQDCDPRSYQCTPVVVDESFSPYAYVAISKPQNKSRYYVQVQSDEGSGTYTLTSRGYVQNPDQPVALMAQNENTPNNSIQSTSIQINSVQGVIPQDNGSQVVDTQESRSGTSILSFSFSSMHG